MAGVPVAAGAEAFKADMRLDGHGMSLASAENKAHWTLEHYKELETRQKMWAEITAEKPKPVAAPAAPGAGSLADKAAKEIKAITEAVRSIFTPPPQMAGAGHKSRTAQALLLSHRIRTVGRELSDSDLIEFLNNPCDLNIITLGPALNPTTFSEDLALSAQAKLVDSNASASVAQYLRTVIQLVKVANQMETTNSEVHVWTWALHLGILIGELSEQHIRFTQKLVALLKMGAPTKGAAETQEAHELNLKNYAKEAASLEGLLARIKGCTHVIKDLAAWAELFKCGTTEEQREAAVLLSVELDMMKSFYSEAFERGDKLAHPPRSMPKSDGASKDLTDHLKKILDNRKFAGARALSDARNPPPSGAAPGKAVVLGKRGPGGDYSDRDKAPRVPGTSRTYFADKTQVEELQTVIDAGNVKNYKFEVCPGTKQVGACPAASADRCKDWHVCFLCVRAGTAAADCFSHPVGPTCPHFLASKQKGQKYPKK